LGSAILSMCERREGRGERRK